MLSITCFPEPKKEKNPLSELPLFAKYEENIPFLERKIKPFQKYKKIIIIAHGGSRTSAYAFYHAFSDKKDIFFLSTNDPQVLKEIKKKYAKEDTLLLAISKSGTTVTLLETLFYFKGYTTLVITQKNSPLFQIAEKEKWYIIEHPAFTSCGLTPAILIGLNTKELVAGAKEVYNGCKKEDNTSLKAAQFLYEQEKKGYTEVFLPIYSFQLSGVLPLIIQLMHETVCKEGKGQTFFGDEAPESQHHTNQRFFGGRKNVVGFFVTRNKTKNKEKIQSPSSCKNIILNQGKVSTLDNISYEDAFQAEFVGTWKDAEKKGIPRVCIELEEITEKGVGAFIAFWQMVALYSAFLRKVNPYDQPHVESSKYISFLERMKKATQS